MAKLGYDKYVFQAGDAGDFIMRFASADFPNGVVAGLSNFWVVPPNEADLERYARKETSDDENYTIEAYRRFIDSSWAYGQIHQTRPQRLAIALTDSPVGLAMWIYDGLRSSVADASIWTPELIITWTMMHWINGPYGTFGLYKNGAKDGTISTKGIGLDLPYVSQPIAISEFPYDLWYRTPLDWAQRAGNVKQRNVHPRGGHFAAFDAPDLLLEDIWRFFGNKEESNTGVFFT
ncbi:alpha/beta-hydrolase [Thozetella sp. PMI_491]|nr:alpha/beta-hydrolase [Thozetella sp. PMI_491]